MSATALPQRLERILGPLDATALVISNVIGIGIFTTPGIIAQIVPHPLVILGLWILGGALAFVGASAYAELAALRPHAGGEYVYLRQAFGSLCGFLGGWTSFIAGFSGAIAAGAVAMATYAGRYVPFAADTRALFELPLGVRISTSKLAACMVIVVLSVVHVRGLRLGQTLQNALTALKILALLMLCTLGFVTGKASTSSFGAPLGRVEPMSWLLAMVAIMFSYSGWNAATYVAEEVREPARNVTRGLMLGTGSVIVLYLLVNSVYLSAIPPQKMAGSINTADVVAETLAGPVGSRLITPVVLVILAGGISAMVIAGARVYFAMGRDGVFPAWLANVHQRYRTPAVAILAQAAWSMILVLSGTFEQILLFTGFAVVLFSALAVMALFFLRHEDRTERPIRAYGYPWAPALFAVLSLAIVVNGILAAPKPSAAGLALILAGIPIYRFLRPKTAVGVFPSSRSF